MCGGVGVRREIKGWEEERQRGAKKRNANKAEIRNVHLLALAQVRRSQHSHKLDTELLLETHSTRRWIKKAFQINLCSQTSVTTVNTVQ